MSNVLELISGLIILLLGGEFLVRGSVLIAKKLKISPFIIGLTIVSFGTSAPELLVSLQATIGGSPDLAVGNVIGSNIFNIMAVIGLTGIIKPIIISSEMLSFDMIWLLGISLFMAPILFIYSKIGRVKGALLLISYFTYIFLVLRGVA